MVPICIVGDSAGRATCEEKGSVTTCAALPVGTPLTGQGQVTEDRLSAAPGGSGLPPACRKDPNTEVPGEQVQQGTQNTGKRG